MSRSSQLTDAGARVIHASTLVNNQISKRAQAVLQDKNAETEKEAALRAEAVDAMCKNGRIYEAQKEKVAAALTDPRVALEMLRDVSCHRNSEEVETIGSEVGRVKSAGDMQSNAYVGQRIADMNSTEAGRGFADKILGSG